MEDTTINWGKDVKKGVKERFRKKHPLVSQEIEIDGIEFTDNDIGGTAVDMTGISQKEVAVEKFCEFFDDLNGGSKILMVGTGMNTLVEQLEERYPKLHFVSADLSYSILDKDKNKKATIEIGTKPEEVKLAKNMIALDWNDLPFSPNSLDAVFGHYSFPYWEDRPGEFDKVVEKVSEIVKKNGKWYFDGRFRSDEFLDTLVKNEWGIVDGSYRLKDDGFDDPYFVGQAVNNKNDE